MIEHGFTSAPTQYRLYGRRFLRVWWPNQQCNTVTDNITCDCWRYMMSVMVAIDLSHTDIQKSTWKITWFQTKKQSTLPKKHHFQLESSSKACEFRTNCYLCLIIQSPMDTLNPLASGNSEVCLKDAGTVCCSWKLWHHGLNLDILLWCQEFSGYCHIQSGHEELESLCGISRHLAVGQFFLSSQCMFP